jgi:rare lipoprotein A
MKLLSSFFFIILFLSSCQLENNKTISKVEKKIVKVEKKIIEAVSVNKLKEKKQKTNNAIFYLIGDPYFIEGVEYIPEENYSYVQSGLATFYDKELHNVKTANNDINKVTELLGRHKTLPLPSIVKITNLENGSSLIIKINDRYEDNVSLIQVSRKVSQLLRFYKNKIARVKLEVLTDPSKQNKIVLESMNQADFNKTIDLAPTESVSISDLDEVTFEKNISNSKIEQPIELKLEEVSNQDLFVKVYGFESYNETKNIIDLLNIKFNITTQKEGDSYSVIIGPIENVDANKLVSSFISKGYKNTEIILE